MLALAGSLTTARAGVPSSPPVFTNPTNITNAYFPFQPGGSKVFTGFDNKKRIVFVDNYLNETRSFILNGKTVECRVMRELAFESGDLHEIADNYFAQADDGTVYYFGEVVDNYEEGVIVDNNGSWLVGGPTLPTDPVDSAPAAVPAVFMPGNPELGDIFKPEDLFPIVDETGEIVQVGRTVSALSGIYRDTIVVKENTRLSTAVERKTYAPGIGVIQVRGKTELLQLAASTLVQD